MTVDVEVIAEPDRAQALLQPARMQILERLAEPGSAASLSRVLDLPRQRINYHLRELEQHKLVTLVDERQRGSITERIYQRSGDSYAISVAALGELGSRPEVIQDQFSTAYQLAVASRAIADIAELRGGADAAQKKLPTLSMEVEVRFANAASRNAFAEELTNTVAKLVRKYHDEDARGGRLFRFYVGAYPKPKA